MKEIGSLRVGRHDYSLWVGLSAGRSACLRSTIWKFRLYPLPAIEIAKNSYGVYIVICWLVFECGAEVVRAKGVP